MVSVDSTILALTIMPAKELEHLFLRVLPGKRTKQQIFSRAFTDQVIRGCAFLASDSAKKAHTLQG
jgi:hypothetical protein